MDQRLKRVKLTILPKLIHEFNAFKSVLNRRLLAKTKVAEKKKRGSWVLLRHDRQMFRFQTTRLSLQSKEARAETQTHTRVLESCSCNNCHGITTYGAKMNLQPYFTPYTNFD